MALSDQELQNKTQEFRQRLAQGESLTDLLPEAFATVREASRRVLGMRHFDVQLKGGIFLHRGMIAEMKTGEGKTLVATLPVYLNALVGKGVHVVTVNDYLAQRDSGHMGHIYKFLGLSVGCIIQDLTNTQRYDAYHSDITYGTNNEFGFDYLRDNMKFSIQEMCQRPFYYAIVDEVDSILIDEARTPLIISGPAEDSSDLYVKVNDIILQLVDGDYEKEEKTKSISFTDQGYEHVEHLVQQHQLIQGDDLFQPINLMLVHHLNQALKAQKMFHRDIDYIVRDDKVIIIDEFTGRMMKGRRYSDGLHQALEAKEGVTIEEENRTLASITFQNYFRMYPKLAGMTGTALTEAHEFDSIYKLPVIAIPTNEPVARKDLDDEIFRTFDQKKAAIIQQVKECYERKQPILVGTASIEKSELFSRALMKENIPHHVLNARQHEKEAMIIAEAGLPGAVTIATNMAGRGTDIKLGGNLDVQLAQALTDIEDPVARAEIEADVRAKVASQAAIAREAGGLFILGTERHENRRIDNQLRGRSGRQGDPGISKFYISLEDDLMRIFGPNLALMNYSLRKNEQKDNEPIAHPWLTRAIEKAQQRVEAQHFDTRKTLLKYAEVLNAQRKAVYEERMVLMSLENVSDHLNEMISHTIDALVSFCTPEKNASSQWNLDKLSKSIQEVFSLSYSWQHEDTLSYAKLIQDIQEKVSEHLALKREAMASESIISLEKNILLHTLDTAWIHHINAMEHLRSGIHLQAYGQKDPLNEYKREAFLMFQGMRTQWYHEALKTLFSLQPYVENQALSQTVSDFSQLSYEHDENPENEEGSVLELETIFKEMQTAQNTEKSTTSAVSSRNALCHCGSGKRFKHCHGALLT
jgi:preprotein translocase subunit SecA